MIEERRNRDFSKGPVWDPATNRWRVEIRYPDGTRLRKRLRRELREALNVIEQFEQREPIEAAINQVHAASDAAYFYAGVAFGAALTSSP